MNKYLLGSRTTPPVVPTITSFTPASGAVGDTVTIMGTNFGAVPGTAGTVKFDGLLATGIVSWNNTTIQVKVPIGATTGLLTVTTAAGTAASSMAFTVSTTGGTTTGGQGGATATYDLSTSSAAFAYNVVDIPQSGFRQRSPFASIFFQADHTSLTATLNTNGYGNSVVETNMALYVNGAWFANLVPPASATGPAGTALFVDVTIMGLPAGSKIIECRQGASAWSAATGYYDWGVKKIVLSGGSTAAIYLPARKPKRAIFLGDSILNTSLAGSADPVNVINGLRQAKPDWEITSNAASGGYLSGRYATPASRQALAVAYVNYFAGASQKTILKEDMTNAYGFGATPAVYASDMADFFDRVRLLDPTVRFESHTAFARSDEATVIAGAVLNDYRTIEVQQVASGRGQYVTEHAGSDAGLVQPTDFQDQSGLYLHPNVGGVAKLVTWYGSILDASVPGTGSTAGAVPSLDSVTPAAGPATSQVVLTGAGFDASQGSNSVYFTAATGADLLATVVSWSATSITVQVPVGAATNALIYVVTSVSGSNQQPFTVTVTSGLYFDYELLADATDSAGYGLDLMQDGIGNDVMFSSQGGKFAGKQLRRAGSFRDAFGPNGYRFTFQLQHDVSAGLASYYGYLQVTQKIQVLGTSSGNQIKVQLVHYDASGQQLIAESGYVPAANVNTVDVSWDKTQLLVKVNGVAGTPVPTTSLMAPGAGQDGVFVGYSILSGNSANNPTYIKAVKGYN